MTTTEQRASPVGRAIEAVREGGTVVITVLAFVCAIVVGAVLIIIADEPTRTAMGYFFAYPWDTFAAAWHAVSGAYLALFEGSVLDFGSLTGESNVPLFGPIADTLFNAAPLILGGLSVGVAFRAGLFNIGGQGQLIAGAICAGYVGFTWHLPVLLHLLVAMVAGIVGGAIWGGIAGWLKAATGAHEVISTIMLNYIALYLLFYLLSVPGFQAAGSNQAISIPVEATARFPHLFGSGLSVNGSLVVALLAALACWWLLTRSTLGFRLRAVGANQFAARTAGMSVAGSYVTVMLIAGALSGLAGSAQILGGNNAALTGDVDANIGFDAITVALLGRASPGGTVWAGILFGALRAGAVRMQAETGVPTEIVQVVQSVIVLFIAAPALIRAIFRLRESRASGVGQLAKGWNG
ncbi:MAG: ABC transporter permease [Pseudonocardia sp.]|nr:ABC transporter permease [Pseudonocardia sp.]